MEKIPAPVASSSTAVSIAEGKREKKIKTIKISNEEQNKKIVEISESTMNNLDPVEYFSRFLDIPEMILQHLNGTDLIKVSEVSPSSYSFIGSSKVLMKKIKVVVKIRNPEMNSDDYDLLNVNLRQYQNLEVNIRKDELSSNESFDMNRHNKFVLFLVKAHNWKNVSIIDTLFSDSDAAWLFFCSIESTVESLSLDRVGVCETIPGLTFETLTFPKLKELKLVNVTNKIGCVQEFLKNTSAVEKFEFSYVIDSPQKFYGGRELALEMFKSFDKLTSLTLYKRNMYKIFNNQSWSQIQFKLKSFAMIYSEYYERYNSFSMFNLVNFLQMQTDHLEKLTIEVYMNKRFFNMIMNMPKLKSLSIMNFSFSFICELKKSVTITELTVKDKFLSKDIKNLLFLFPNVKRLSIVDMTQDIFLGIVTMIRKFKELKVHDLRIDKKILEIVTDKISSFPFPCDEGICDCLK